MQPLGKKQKSSSPVPLRILKQDNLDGTVSLFQVWLLRQLFVECIKREVLPNHLIEVATISITLFVVQEQGKNSMLREIATASFTCYTRYRVLITCYILISVFKKIPVIAIKQRILPRMKDTIKKCEKICITTQKDCSPIVQNPKINIPQGNKIL